MTSGLAQRIARQRLEDRAAHSQRRAEHQRRSHPGQPPLDHDVVDQSRGVAGEVLGGTCWTE